MKRKIPTNIVKNTIFGLEIAKKICNTCNKEKEIIHFYCESKRRTRKTTRHGEQVRNQCIECWSILKGRPWRNEYIMGDNK